MRKKTVTELLSEFKKEHPLYDELKFEGQGGIPEALHPIFVFTQAIIENLASKGEQKVAIVLPDNAEIIPLVVMDCMARMAEDVHYTENVFDNIVPGDHLSIKKAVIEFKGIDYDAGTVSYVVGRQTSDSGAAVMTKNFDSPIVRAIQYYAEKTEKEVSSFKAYSKMAEAVKQEFASGDSDIIKMIKGKRTLLKKTIVLMTQKVDLRSYFEEVNVSGMPIEDVVSFGKVNNNSKRGYEFYNSGKLRGIPAITATTDMSETADAIKIFENQVEKIYVAPEKSDEIVEDDYNLKKCLKLKIPVIVFLYEKDIKNYTSLKAYGFKIWHWKPATMKSEAFLTDSIEPKAVLFGQLAQKVNCASFAEIKAESFEDISLRQCGNMLYDISPRVKDYATDVQKVINKLWKFYKSYERICYIDDKERDNLVQMVSEIGTEWSAISASYVGQTMQKTIDDIIAIEMTLAISEKNKKQEKLKRVLEELCENAVVIIPYECKNLIGVQQFVERVSGGKAVAHLLSEFAHWQDDRFESYSKVIVPWFDKKHYTDIKQLYCYDTLIFLLYDFENKRRGRWVSYIDKLVPYDDVKTVADVIGIADTDYYDRPIDEVNSSPEDVPIEDYDFRDSINMNFFRARCGATSRQADGAEQVESILIEFDGEKYGYFYPTYKVFDITKIANGTTVEADSKEAKDLKSGDIIAEHSGTRDMIREIADKKMRQEGKSAFRGFAQKWFDLLLKVAQGRTIPELQETLNRYGAECSSQQCRVWLSGETIMPRKPEVLKAIGAAAEEIGEPSAPEFIGDADRIFACGSEIHGYHLKAGRELKAKLAKKADDIRQCVKSGKMESAIDGVGAIRIYRVESVAPDRYYVERAKLNRIEEN